jgi:hypothetical protein
MSLSRRSFLATGSAALVAAVASPALLAAEPAMPTRRERLTIRLYPDASNPKRFYEGVRCSTARRQSFR